MLIHFKMTNLEHLLHNYEDVRGGWAARGRCIQYWTQRSPGSPDIMIIITITIAIIDLDVYTVNENVDEDKTTYQELSDCKYI